MPTYALVHFPDIDKAKTKELRDEYHPYRSEQLDIEKRETHCPYPKPTIRVIRAAETVKDYF